MFRTKRDHSGALKYLCLYKFLALQQTNFFSWNYFKTDFPPLSNGDVLSDSVGLCCKSTFDFNCKGLKFHSLSRQDDKTKHITLSRKGNYVCLDSWLHGPLLNALSISVGPGSVSNAVIRPLTLQDYLNLSKGGHCKRQRKVRNLWLLFTIFAF